MVQNNPHRSGSSGGGQLSRSLDTAEGDDIDEDAYGRDSPCNEADMECLPWERQSEFSDNEAEEARLKLIVANEKKRLNDVHHNNVLLCGN